MSKYIQELKDVIRKVHGVDANYVQSVPVKETFEGRTIWDGTVEIFDLVGHPTAERIYAWAHDTENPDMPRRHVTVLHVYPVKSAQDAVKVAILQEFKNRGTAEEN